MRRIIGGTFAERPRPDRTHAAGRALDRVLYWEFYFVLVRLLEPARAVVWNKFPASNQKIEEISEAAIGLIFISSEYWLTYEQNFQGIHTLADHRQQRMFGVPALRMY